MNQSFRRATRFELPSQVPVWGNAYFKDARSFIRKPRPRPTSEKSVQRLPFTPEPAGPCEFILAMFRVVQMPSLRNSLDARPHACF